MIRYIKGIIRSSTYTHGVIGGAGSYVDIMASIALLARTIRSRYCDFHIKCARTST